MLWVDRVGDRRSSAILARNFFAENENSLNYVSTCLKVVDTRRCAIHWPLAWSNRELTSSLCSISWVMLKFR
jgi:hypothetical protein